MKLQTSETKNKTSPWGILATGLILTALPTVAEAAPFTLENLVVYSFPEQFDTSFQQYTYYSFSEGTVPMWVDTDGDGEVDKVGYYSPKGEEIIAPIFADGEKFSQGLAAVDVGEQEYVYGYIDSEGNFVIEPEYLKATPFSDGLAAVFFEENGVNTGYYINQQNQKQFMPNFDTFSAFHEGMALVGNDSDKDGRIDQVGFINAQGEVVVQPKYNEAYRFSDGLALVGISTDSHNFDAERWGYINSQGEEVIPLTYVDAYEFSEGMAGFGVDTTGDGKADRYGYLNSQGEEVLPAIYLNAGYYSQGLCAVTMQDPETGSIYNAYIDTEGVEVLRFTGFVEGYPFVDGYAIVCSIDNDGVRSYSSIRHPWAPKEEEEEEDTTTNDRVYKTAKVSTAKITINSTDVALSGYTIEGYNYFKLTDVAYALQGTHARMAVNWNQELYAIELYTQQDYSPDGSEMQTMPEGDKQASLFRSGVYLDGELVELTAYIIDNRSYFQLENLRQILDFEVSWENSTKTIAITTPSYG